MPKRACIRCSGVDRQTWRPSPGWSCGLRSACGSTPPMHGISGTGWSGPCLRAASPAAGVRSQYKESRTGWPRIWRRKLRAWLSPCSVRTYTHSPQVPCGKLLADRPSPPNRVPTTNYAFSSPNLLSENHSLVTGAHPRASHPTLPFPHAGSDSGATSSILPRSSRSTLWHRRAKATL